MRCCLLFRTKRAEVAWTLLTTHSLNNFPWILRSRHIICITWFSQIPWIHIINFTFHRETSRIWWNDDHTGVKHFYDYSTYVIPQLFRIDAGIRMIGIQISSRAPLPSDNQMLFSEYYVSYSACLSGRPGVIWPQSDTLVYALTLSAFLNPLLYLLAISQYLAIGFLLYYISLSAIDLPSIIQMYKYMCVYSYYRDCHVQNNSIIVTSGPFRATIRDN